MINVIAQFPLGDGWPRPAMYTLGVTTIVVHHTAVDPQSTERGQVALLLPAADMSQEDELNHIRVIHLYHKSIGYGGFGYQGITFASGRSYLVTPLTRMGAHVAGNNGGKWGWVLAGDFRDRLPGNAQISGAREAVVMMGDKEIKPHSAYGGTTCPGRAVEILDRLKEDDDMGMTAEEKLQLDLLKEQVARLEKEVEADKENLRQVGGSLHRRFAKAREAWHA